MKIQGREVDAFTASYIETAFWSELDEDGSPLDKNYGWDDLAPETLDRMIFECAAFQVECGDVIDAATVARHNRTHSNRELAGHDFWLTRNGHGAGFWDGDWSEPHASKLDAAAERASERNLYVGDDGRIYCCQG